MDLAALYEIRSRPRLLQRVVWKQWLHPLLSQTPPSFLPDYSRNLILALEETPSY